MEKQINDEYIGFKITKEQKSILDDNNVGISKFFRRKLEDAINSGELKKIPNVVVHSDSGLDVNPDGTIVPIN